MKKILYKPMLIMTSMMFPGDEPFDWDVPENVKQVQEEIKNQIKKDHKELIRAHLKRDRSEETVKYIMERRGTV